MAQSDSVFSGTILVSYDRHLGPLFFERYATNLADRLAYLKDGRVLETAAGTGIVTRMLARKLPEAVEIVATDLNQPMLDFAMMHFDRRKSRLRQLTADSAGVTVPMRRPRQETQPIETVPQMSRARSPRNAVIGLCQGTPLRNEIEARDPGGLEAATEAAARAVAARFGTGPISAKMQAHVITAAA